MIDHLSIDPNEPIVLKDRVLGICIRFSESEIGVQVPGESNIRWIPTSDISQSPVGLIEKGWDAPQHTRISQRIVTRINPDGSYDTQDCTTFDGRRTNDPFVI